MGTNSAELTGLLKQAWTNWRYKTFGDVKLWAKIVSERERERERNVKKKKKKKKRKCYGYTWLHLKLGVLFFFCIWAWEYIRRCDGVLMSKYKIEQWWTHMTTYCKTCPLQGLTNFYSRVCQLQQKEACLLFMWPAYIHTS
jgi:hypothetical protein